MFELLRRHTERQKPTRDRSYAIDNRIGPSASEMSVIIIFNGYMFSVTVKRPNDGRSRERKQRALYIVYYACTLLRSQVSVVSRVKRIGGVLLAGLLKIFVLK